MSSGCRRRRPPPLQLPHEEVLGWVALRHSSRSELFSTINGSSANSSRI